MFYFIRESTTNWIKSDVYFYASLKYGTEWRLRQTCWVAAVGYIAPTVHQVCDAQRWVPVCALSSNGLLFWITCCQEIWQNLLPNSAMSTSTYKKISNSCGQWGQNENLFMFKYLYLGIFLRRCMSTYEIQLAKFCKIRLIVGCRLAFSTSHNAPSWWLVRMIFFFWQGGSNFLRNTGCEA